MTLSSKRATALAAEAVWDPVQQIYVGGGVPSHNEEAVEEFLKQDTLRIFGYGSLCWSPGDGTLANHGVTSKLGRVFGYKRCWAQRSTDHRGVPMFPGIVCTLLKDEEVIFIASHRQSPNILEKPSVTEGVVYTIPPEQVEACLEELDFREKGGYARDVVEVIEYDSGQAVKALLYRGTTENPAFWERALLDLAFAAAVMSIAVGPSGRNSEYLYNLDRFISDPNVATPSTGEFHGDTDTRFLAACAHRLESQQLYFLFVCGSNQHNQLLLKSDSNKACLSKDAECSMDIKEAVLCTDLASDASVKSIDAGGGHSALLTNSGELYLWGWNDDGQLGRIDVNKQQCELDSFPVIPKLSIYVEKVALGFSHSLVIEKETSSLYAFGSNNRGQVGAHDSITATAVPTPIFPGVGFIDVAAGLFHSACITIDGDLITFGCNRFGQAPTSPWKPSDGSALVRVACGRRHTVALDDRGRVWTIGDNKYGQLGRSVSERKGLSAQLVDGFLGKEGSGCFEISCGWSHCVVAINKPCGSVELLGWGRNDKGQLGLGFTGDVNSPMPLAEGFSSISCFSCGSESTMLVDTNGRVFGCGWNEHGNLGTGDDIDSMTMRMATGAIIVSPPPLSERAKFILSAGGAHVFAIRQQNSE